MNETIPDTTTSTPASPTLSAKLFALGGVVISCAYLANIGFGTIGEIPDIIPGLGNLDEVFFSGLLIVSMHKLGIPVIPGLTSGRPPIANLPDTRSKAP